MRPCSPPRWLNAAAEPPALPIPGDYDDNGKVEFDDFALWKTHFGETRSPFAPPDGNGNGVVDAADYTVWRDALGQTASETSLAAIPEPTALASAATALILLLAHAGCRGRADSASHRASSARPSQRANFN